MQLNTLTFKIAAGVATVFCIAVFPRTVPETRGQASTAVRPRATEISLGKIDPEWIDYSLAISPDGRHVAYVAKRAGGKCVVLDGRAGKTYPDIPEQPLTERGRERQIRFSPNGNRVAYVARRADGYVVVADGVEGNPYEYIEVGAPVFSADSTRLAYVAKRNNKEIIVVDGVEGMPCDYLEVVPLRFRPQGNRIDYVVRRGDSSFAVIDGKEAARGDDVGPISYSKDGAHYAYKVREGDSSRVVVDGVAGRRYPRLGNDVLFSEDGKHVLYRATTIEGDFLVLDGSELKKRGIISENNYGFTPDGRPVYTLQISRNEYYIEIGDRESGPYEFVSGASPRFSSDGKHVAFEARRHGKALMVVDGAEIPEFDEIDLAGFSPDGNKFLYIGTRGGKHYLTAAGKTLVYDEIADAVFSPDSKHLAVAAKADGKWFVDIDGKRLKTYDSQVLHLEFSPSGNHLLFTIKRGNKLAVVFDGTEQAAYDQVGQITFNPNGKDYVYVATHGKSAAVVIDGTEFPGYDSILTPPEFDESGVVRFIARRLDEFFRVEIKVAR